MYLNGSKLLKATKPDGKKSKGMYSPLKNPLKISKAKNSHVDSSNQIVVNPKANFRKKFIQKAKTKLKTNKTNCIQEKFQAEKFKPNALTTKTNNGRKKNKRTNRHELLLANLNIVKLIGFNK